MNITKNLIPGAKCTRCKEGESTNHAFLCDSCLNQVPGKQTTVCTISSPGVDDFEFLAFLDGRRPTITKGIVS